MVTTWLQIFVRYLSYMYKSGERQMARITHLMKVTLLWQTEEVAESSQVVSLGQYIT